MRLPFHKRPSGRGCSCVDPMWRGDGRCTVCGLRARKSKRPMRPACLYHAELGAKRCSCPDGGPFADLVGLDGNETDAQRRDLATLRTALVDKGLDVALYEKYVAGVIEGRPLLRILSEDLAALSGELKGLRSELEPLKASLSITEKDVLRRAEGGRACDHRNQRKTAAVGRVGYEMVCTDCGAVNAGGDACTHDYERVMRDQTRGGDFWVCSRCGHSMPAKQAPGKLKNPRFRHVSPTRAQDIEDGTFSWDCAKHGHAWNELWDDGLDCIACGVSIPADVQGKPKTPPRIPRRDLLATLTWVDPWARSTEYHFKPNAISNVTERPDSYFDVLLKDGSTYRRMCPKYRKATDTPGGYLATSHEALRTKRNVEEARRLADRYYYAGSTLDKSNFLP